MSNDITHEIYLAEIETLALSIASETMANCDNNITAAMTEISNHTAAEIIEAHRWIIYNKFNSDVLECSDNDEYMAKEIGGISEALKAGGLSRLVADMAYWAMLADVEGLIQGCLDEIGLNAEDEKIDNLGAF